MSEVPLYSANPSRCVVPCSVCHPAAPFVRTGSWTGPPRGKRAPRIEISSTVFGVRA